MDPAPSAGAAALLPVMTIYLLNYLLCELKILKRV
jgi:hypothetical protein